MKRSIINEFSCVIEFGLSLALRHLKVLNFWIPQNRTLHLSKVSEIFVQFCEKKFIRDFKSRKIMLPPCTCKIFLAFSAVINSNVKLSQNKLCCSCTALDTPCLYKIPEAKNLSLISEFCGSMRRVVRKTYSACFREFVEDCGKRTFSNYNRLRWPIREFSHLLLFI